MHGVIAPASGGDPEANLGTWQTLRELLFRFRHFGLIVILPTLIVAAYYYLIASDQYESSAAYVVRKADAGVSGSSGLGQVLGMSFGLSQTQTEAYVIEDYLLSHDAVARLRKEDELVARFRRPFVDWISKLWYSEPQPESLLKYYLNRVTIVQDTETGISHISVTAFTPEDAFHINNKLLRMGEERINALNARSFNDQVQQSLRDYELAEQHLAQVQAEVTRLRQARGDIDPQGSGRAQITLVSTLTAGLTEAKARLAAMGRLISPSSPQYRALAAQVASQEAEVAALRGHMAGQGDATMANNLGDYEELVVRREFAAQRFNVAAAAYEQAKAEARKKQLYLIRVVDANKPVKSLYPERGRIVLTLFLALFLTYAIGRMLLAGLREHSL